MAKQRVRYWRVSRPKAGIAKSTDVTHIGHIQAPRAERKDNRFTSQRVSSWN